MFDLELCAVDFSRVTNFSVCRVDVAVFLVDYTTHLHSCVIIVAIVTTIIIITAKQSNRIGSSYLYTRYTAHCMCDVLML